MTMVIERGGQIITIYHARESPKVHQSMANQRGYVVSKRELLLTKALKRSNFPHHPASVFVHRVLLPRVPGNPS